jgi:hypothetical protein
MRLPRHPLLLTSALLLAVAAMHCVAFSQELPAGPPLRPSAPGHERPPMLQLQGAGSCAASACHNEQGSAGLRGREYALALERDAADPRQRARDRHAQAYEVLFEPRARKIELTLHPNAVSPRPELDAVCLRCHVLPGYDTHPVRMRDGIAQFQLQDGVGCEACHGAAERWLAPHFRSGWQELSAAGRLALGQADTRSLPARIRLCADCHVGAPGMDVNHDLIAAGHPRLSFEFASFHFLLHKHWDYAKDRDPNADPRGRRDFEARAWLLGQLSAARAALALLADRADASDHDPRRPWPEFAEYDCFACHHDLGSPRWQLASGQRKAGTLPASRWYTTQLPNALAGFGLPVGAPLRDALTEVRAAMDANRPDRKQVADRARRAVALLDQRLADASAAPAAGMSVDDLLRQITRAAVEQPVLGWDDTAQLYLAIAAMQRARDDMGLPLRPLALPNVRALLQFPPSAEISERLTPSALGATLKELTGDEPR